ncbi:MAG: hypothetical protein U9R75_04555, partial [Candidatus Thermoplasmatota archaeon]|nr:hypothetical protein [Candidatus Thermoplasmatota archaeon]
MIKVHLSFVVILFLLFPSLLFIFTNDGTGLDDATENIIFNGNASFTGASSLYVRSGTGIQSDPYIVSDHNMTSYNIQFISTTSFVIVRNITFSASSSWAITLTSTRNVILDNITCIGRSTFLYSSSCRNIILTDSI